MSAADPGSTGKMLQNFRLVDRASASVWRAEDARTGKTVAVKILSKGLPKDQAKRETLVREVRQNAALYHSFLVGIQEVAVAGDSLLLVMEWLDAQPLSKLARGKPVSRTDFFRIFYQVADALKLIHAKGLIHGNVAGDAILVLPNGHAKLAGLNLSNILPRQGQPSQFQQKGNNLDAVSYMAPEQITNQPTATQTDIFSVGLAMFEASTGRLPYLGTTAAEVAHKIVDEHPPSPKSIHPSIDNAVLNVMGGCLFKDSFKRLKDGKALVDAITKVDADAQRFAMEVAKAAAAAPASAQQAQARSSILFIADIANYDELNATNPATAAKSAARMQQILGEAVYLFEGKVLDPFGPRMIAEMASVETAVEAGRKGEFDFSQDQQTGDVIPVRILLHAGAIEAKEGSVTGAGVSKAIEVLKALPPFTLHVTEDFARLGKVPVRLRDAGAKAGVKLATIVPPEPKDDEDTELATAAEAASEAAEAAAAAAQVAAIPAKKKRTRIIGVFAVVALMAIGGVVAILMRPKAETVQALALKKPSGPAPASASAPRKVMLSVTGADPALADRVAAITLAVTEILKSIPEVSVADAVAPDVVSVAAQLRTGATGPEMVIENEPPLPAVDNASVIQPILQLLSSRLQIPPRGAANAEAYNAFADAVAADKANDLAKTEAALRIATKADPNFLAAQLMAMRFFTAQNKPLDAVEAAKVVLAAQPENETAARMVARTSLSTGDLTSAFRAYAVIIKKNPNDIEALNAIGKYALAAGDLQKLTSVLKRLAAAPAQADVHEPDVLLATGKFDAAVERYYTIEEKVPSNASLSLKIGRIAVLRHSAPIAEIELKKLQDVDPLYGLHLLKAYLAAQGGDKATAAEELKAALNGSTPGDDYWTSVAEVGALNGDPAAVLDALGRAAERKEPTASYILHNPLFSFLATDERFQTLRATFTAQQTEIRNALAAVSL